MTNVKIQMSKDMLTERNLAFEFLYFSIISLYRYDITILIK